MTGEQARTRKQAKTATLNSAPRAVPVAELQLPFVFTDQHAYPAMANYYTDLHDLGEIDWAFY